MGIIFRRGDTPRAKAITLGFLSLMFVMINGMLHGSVIPSPLLKPWAVGFAFLLAPCAALIALSDRNPVSKFVHMGVLKRWAILLLFVMPFSAFMGYFLVLFGIPVLHSQLTEPTGYADAYVMERWERSGRGCNFNVNIWGKSMPSKIRACIAERDWRKLKVGDGVSISYSQSILGFVVKDIRVR